MIRYTTRVEGDRFIAKFNLSPQDVSCSRGNYTATHKGAGTTSRYGIWEGVQLVEVWGRVNESNPWVNLGTNVSPEIYTTANNNTIQLKAKYRIKTMGYHWQCTNGSIPFFFYGNIGGRPTKYVHGNFTDSHAVAPTSNLHGIHAVVPKDWKLVATEWSDWAYKHGQATSNWEVANGRYEQRNGNTEAATSSNGWISDSGYKQAYRKSCMFTFEKEFTVLDIKSSGISIDATTPILEVIPTKGSSGQLSLTYKGDAPGKIWLQAYCLDKKVIINDYDTSVDYVNNKKVTYTIDFEKTFGSNYEGNDITYEAWARNSYNKESAGTGKKGGHRYNGRPSIPTGLYVTGKNNLIYDKIKFSWNASIDPDDDKVIYDLWLKAVKPDGSIIKDNYIAKNLDALSFDYNIANHPDDTLYYFYVRAFDGLIYSEWTNHLTFTKGAKPKGTLNLISPVVDETNLYADKTRFIFEGYDGQSSVAVNYNGTVYTSTANSDMFSIQGDKVGFKKDTSKDKNIKLQAYLKNKYGISERSPEYIFTRIDARNNISSGEFIKANLVAQIQKQIIDKAIAYKIKTNISASVKDSIIEASDFNKCVKALKAINDSINNIINNDKFKVKLVSEEVNTEQFINSILWENLIKDIKKI